MTENSPTLEAGFRSGGARWSDTKLYYFNQDTRISYTPDEKYPGMFRVVYPDGVLSADCYNITRVKMHCRDVALAIYPRP